ncbi:MAG: glycosyltransferase [Verrucomicrobiales bacterium]|nr:glycosyltransferase [Verrucomicrobiales bacterium]
MTDALPIEHAPGGAVEHAFDRGDYASAALFGHEGDWRTHAAKGLIGLAKPALEGLARFSVPEARFYEGVTHWIDGNDAVAVKALAGLTTEHARKLLALLRKPKIQVLSQCDRGSQWDFITSIREDQRFEIVNYGFDVNDQPIRPYADIRRCFDEKRPPDFYVAKMLEWHLLPPNLQTLPCPVFGHTADYDLHIQAVHPWLGVFDEVLTTDQTEWRDVSQLRQGPVSVFPKAFGLALKLPAVPDGLRALDVFISGTTQHPYHPDKARLIHQVLRNRDLKVKFLEGFLPMADYLNILGCTRAAFTYIRHPGGMPTRGMESLAMGAAIAVQEESILRAYLGENEGVVSYSLEKGDLPDALQRITREWELFRERALIGAGVVRQEFTSTRAASQYFRFLTFLAAKPRAARVEVDPRLLRQKRSILCKGWSWRPAVNLAVRQRSLKEWASDLTQQASAACVINMARELVLEFATAAYFPAAQVYHKNYNARSKIDREVLSSALDLYRLGMRRFPRSLVLRFNFIRAALHFGEPEEVSQALMTAIQTLTGSQGNWEVSCDEDVFPWDFFGQFFNYRSYFDRCTLALQRREDASADLSQLILGSIAYYLACYSEADLRQAVGPGFAGPDAPKSLRLEYVQQAIAQDAEFPLYRLLKARLLLEVNEPAADQQAVVLLADLAEHSMLHAQATLLLRQMEARGFQHRRLADLLEYAQLTEGRMHQTTVGREDWETLPLRAASPTSLSDGELVIPPAAEAESQPVVNPGSPQIRKPRILYLCLEFAQWQYAKRLAYPAGLGMEEGFRANDVEWVTIPSVCGFSETARLAWQKQVRRLCAGQHFDQVWVELVHSEWDEEFWQWISGLAPIRVGLVMESLRYDPEVYVQAPQLRDRHARVLERLSHVTHALCIDEIDAEELNQKRTVAAIWWPQTVPGRSILPPPGPSPDRRALFSGAIYGNRSELLHLPALRRLLTFQLQPGEDSTRYPGWFDELFRTFDSLLCSGQAIDPESLLVQLEAWRRIRTACFDLWLRGLQAGGPVVNLPSYVNSFAGRVFEAMAAGRPVVSWEMAQRPRALGLFRRGEEIAFFEKNDAQALAAEVEQLLAEPALGERRVRQAQETVRCNHTTERRVAQVLEWIRSGLEPDYVGQRSPVPIASAPVHPRAVPVGSPALRPWLGLLAEIRSAQGEISSALECLEVAIASAGKDLSLQLSCVRIALESGDWVRARRGLETLVRLDPRDRGTLRMLAEICRRQNQPDLARRVAEQLSAQASDDLEVQVEASAVALAETGPRSTSDDEGRAWLMPLVEVVELAFQRFAERSSSSGPAAVSRLGDIASARSAFESRRFAEAWDATWDALRLRPFHPEAWLLQCQIAKAVGDERLYKECVSRLRKRVPKWKSAKSLPNGVGATSATQVHLGIPEWAKGLGNAAPRLSVCLIVKNEERFIESCLKSVRRVADQIVVVDTGSTDRTVELAEAAGAEVHAFEWSNDFSVARNAALEFVRGDWVLVLDADEELLPDSEERLRQLMRTDAVLAWRLPLADVGKEKEGYHYVPRLFRNIPGACFTGRIHEHAFGSLERPIEEWGMENRIGNAQLRHHGYSDQVVKERSKVARNLKLLSVAIEEQPHDISLRMSYGLELVRSGQLDAGLEEYGRAFAAMNQQPAAKVPPELRERLLTLMASHLVSAQRFQSLIELSASAAVKASGPTASLHMLFGVGFYLQRKFDEAAKHLKSCVAKRNQPALSPILPDIHSVAPRHMLALSSIQLGLPLEADKEYRLALEEDPASAKVRLDYARFLEQADRWVPALEQLHHVITVKPGELAAWRLGADIALRKPEFGEFAADWTAEAVKHFPRDPVLGIARAEVLLRMGELEQSLELWARFEDRTRISHRAALILCQVLAGQPVESLSPEQEPMVSQEFCGWFRRLVGSGSESVVRRIGDSLPRLETVLPSAAAALRAVLADAQVA